MPNKGLAGLTYHSVLEIVLPDKTSFIFDGTLAQYGYDFTKIWLVPKDVYEANYTLPADEPFWGLEQEDVDHFVSVLDKEYGGYWMRAWDRMSEVIPGLNWQDLSNRSVKEVCNIVAPLALTAFERAWEEVWDSTAEGEEGDEEFAADDE